MRRWQHKVVTDNVLMGQVIPDLSEDPVREEILNSYGRDGWELVSVVLQGFRRESDSLAILWPHASSLLLQTGARRIAEESGLIPKNCSREARVSWLSESRRDSWRGKQRLSIVAE